MSDLQATLTERKKTHGEYLDHANIAQRLKDVIRSGRTYGQCKPHERETLDMIAHKIGRIVSGDPHFADHWHDIAGYAKLSEDRNTPPSASMVGHTGHSRGSDEEAKTWGTVGTKENPAPLPPMPAGDAVAVTEPWPVVDPLENTACPEEDPFEDEDRRRGYIRKRRYEA